MLLLLLRLLLGGVHWAISLLPQLWTSRWQPKPSDAELLAHVRRAHQMARVTDWELPSLTETNVGKAFTAIQRGTQCIFARNAKVLASEWRDELTLEANVHAAIPLLHRMVEHDQEWQADGFVLGACGQQFGDSVPSFARTVRRVLTVLSEADPHKAHCLRRSYLGKRGWVFEFSGATFFITTFAPCYPPTHARFAFGHDQWSFILLQPETSFLRRGLSPDTPKTNWDNPVTERDRIRVAFAQAGRPYFIPPTIIYPPEEHIVKPLVDDGKFMVRWWLADDGTDPATLFAPPFAAPPIRS